MEQVRVAYVYSPALAKAASKLPSNLNRSAMVHSMILDAFCAGKWMQITTPAPITKDDLTQFHSEEFAELLLSAEYLPSDESKEQLQQLEEFGLLHDCPVFPGLGDYVKQIAGGTIAAVQQLMNGAADVAIHWDGGRHHAHRDFASGFCYVNDIVLGILELHKKFKKVLYIDLDIHHCDGVESAFEFSSKVFRLSFHKHEVGFFPGTGSSSDTGSGKGKKHALNIPMPASTTSETFLETFKETLQAVLGTQYLNPNVIVMQCGLDGCRADPLVQQGWKLDSFVIGNCVRSLLDVVDVPVLLLGGGGYSNAMAARGWTYATLQVLKQMGAPVLCASDESTDNLKLVEIPEHQYFDNYIPECLLYAE
ncbi:Histone deacetylase 8 [Chytriomyces hyalinus]|nr:Histone deacetylase 8 [Chytriomyces hyalinus]